MIEINPSDAVVLGLISFVQVVVITMLGIILKRAETTKRDVAATKEQLVNDHPRSPNFRDENDSRHAETKRWIGELKHKQRIQDRRFNRIDDMFLYIATGDKINISKYLTESDKDDDKS